MDASRFENNYGKFDSYESLYDGIDDVVKRFYNHIKNNLKNIMESTRSNYPELTDEEFTDEMTKTVWAMTNNHFNISFANTDTDKRLSIDKNMTKTILKILTAFDEMDRNTTIPLLFSISIKSPVIDMKNICSLFKPILNKEYRNINLPIAINVKSPIIKFDRGFVSILIDKNESTFGERWHIRDIIGEVCFPSSDSLGINIFDENFIVVSDISVYETYLPNLIEIS